MRSKGNNHKYNNRAHVRDQTNGTQRQLSNRSTTPSVTAKETRRGCYISCRCSYGAHELKGKGAQHGETKGKEMEAITTTRMCVLASLRMLDDSHCRGRISPDPLRSGERQPGTHNNYGHHANHGE